MNCLFSSKCHLQLIIILLSVRFAIQHLLLGYFREFSLETIHCLCLIQSFPRAIINFTPFITAMTTEEDLYCLCIKGVQFVLSNRTSKMAKKCIFPWTWHRYFTLATQNRRTLPAHSMSICDCICIFISKWCQKTWSSQFCATSNNN